MDSMKSCVIAYKSLGVGSFDYRFELDNEFFKGFDNSEIIAGNCSVDVQLQRAESMLDVDVKIAGEIIVACDRCLDDCSMEIDYQGELIVKFSAEVEDYDGDILWLSPAESEVDLSQYIYESVILSLPYQRVHPEGECNQEMTRRFTTISGANTDGAEGMDRTEGSERTDRTERAEGSERMNRTERAEGSERMERAERAEEAERRDEVEQIEQVEQIVLTQERVSETHGLSAADLAKLQALRAMMNEE